MVVLRVIWQPAIKRPSRTKSFHERFRDDVKEGTQPKEWHLPFLSRYEVNTRSEGDDIFLQTLLKSL